MSKRASFKQADLTRALRGVRAAGVEPRSCRINPATGEIEMQFGRDISASVNSFDSIIGGK